MQEAGALEPQVDECGLHSRQHSVHPPLEDIPHDAALV
jgi:hypothetical protein